MPSFTEPWAESSASSGPRAWRWRMAHASAAVAYPSNQCSIPLGTGARESCLRPGTSVTPGYRGCFSAFPDDTTDCDLSDCWRGEPPLPYSAHCAVRQFASDYLVRLAAHLTKRNKCTVQVIACPVEALIHLSAGSDFPSGPQAIDCNRRLLQHDDSGLCVPVGFPQGRGGLSGSTRCRRLGP